MLIHKQQLQQQQYPPCSSCYKNLTLIKKYQQLLHLYKKKQIRLSTQGSQISNGKTTSHTLQVPHIQISCLKFAEVFNRLARKNLGIFFRGCDDNKVAVKKIALLNVFSKYNKFNKIKAFQKIKNTHKNQNILPILPQQKNILDQKLQLSLKPQPPKQKTQISILQQLISQLTRPQQKKNLSFDHLTKLKQITISNPHTNNNNDHKNNNNHIIASRIIQQLQIKNATLTLSNNMLKLSLEQLHKRQTKQNQKKKQSLEMLAEEITEKNQEIVHLKQQLKAYQQTYKVQGKVLQDQVVTVKKDVEMLERIRDRLQLQLQKARAQIERLEKQVNQSKQKCIELQQQNTKIRKKSYQADSKISKAQKTSAQFSKLILNLQKKLKRLSVYQNQLLSPNPSTQNNQIKTPTAQILQQSKSQIILLYLVNIADPFYLLPQNSQYLFDQQQKQLLLKCKKDWILLDNQAKLMHKIENNQRCSSKKKLDEISGIQGKADVMDSIFDALDSPRQQQQNQNKNHNHNSHHHQSTTMRMLQLQLQINKQIQKISTLKQKFLHIRIIILNLLKSLQIQTNIKTQTMDILRVVFDMFQYSEQERDSIFVRKKKLFSFL